MKSKYSLDAYGQLMIAIANAENILCNRDIPPVVDMQFANNPKIISEGIIMGIDMWLSPAKYDSSVTKVKRYEMRESNLLKERYAMAVFMVLEFYALTQKPDCLPAFALIALKYLTHNGSDIDQAQIFFKKIGEYMIANLEKFPPITVPVQMAYPKKRDTRVTV